MSFEFITNDPKSRLKILLPFLVIAVIMMLAFVTKIDWARTTLIVYGIIIFFIVIIYSLVILNKSLQSTQVLIQANQLLFTVNKKQTTINVEDIISYQFSFHKGLLIKINSKNDKSFKLALSDTGLTDKENKQTMVTAMERIESEIKNIHPELVRTPSFYEQKWVKLVHIIFFVVVSSLFLWKFVNDSERMVLNLFWPVYFVVLLSQTFYNNYKGLKAFYPNQKVRFF